MKKRILIIDDDPNMHRIVELYLRKEPFDVDGVSSGRVALHKLTDLQYDLIITDIQMPGMNGVELIKKIKERFPNMPILILSAFEESQFNGELGEFSDWRIIPKPFNQVTLTQALSEMLRDNNSN